MKRKPRRKRITKRQKKLAKAVTSGLTFSEAAEVAGYSSKQTAHKAFETIKLRFHPALEAAGYNVDKILTDNFADLLAKKKAKVVDRHAHQGIVMETYEDDAHDIQLRAINEVNRFIGAIRTDHPREEPNTGYAGPAQVSVTLVVADPGRAAAVVAVSANRPSDHQQPRVDAPVDEDQRRSGPEPSL